MIYFDWMPEGMTIEQYIEMCKTKMCPYDGHRPCTLNIDCSQCPKKYGKDK